MRNFQQIASGVDVVPLLLDLHRQPQLWNQHRARTANGIGPHGAADDIWVRFRDQADLVTKTSYATPHTPVFYPAWNALPALRPLVFNLMARVAAVQLGGILITRVPPGAQIAPHDDRGRWHAEFFNTKAYVPLMSNPACRSTCGDETVIMAAGEVWTFNNLIEHATINDGLDDRITLIVCMRCEP